MRPLRSVATRAAITALALACAQGDRGGRTVVSAAEGPVAPPAPVARETNDEAAVVATLAENVGLYDERGIPAFVREVGARVAAVETARPALDYRFDVLDRPEPLAYSVGSRHVFVSRGLLALANSEDEVASVIGHEITHLSRRHAEVRDVAAPAPGPASGFLLGATRAVGGEAAVETLLDFGLFTGFARRAAYAREQERQADEIAQSLAARAGYDPLALAHMLRAIDLEAKLFGGEMQRPSFLDSHPISSDRVEWATSRAAGLRRADAAPPASRADYLARLDGLLVGASPRSGFVERGEYHSLELGFRIRLPDGWIASAFRSGVFATTPDHAATIEIGIDGRGSDPRKHAEAWLVDAPFVVRWRDAVVLGRARGYRVSLDPYVRPTPHPFARADASSRVTWIAHRGRILRIACSTAPQLAKKLDPICDRMAATFRPLSEADLANVHVAVLRVARAGQGETLAQVGKRAGSVWSPAMLAVANGAREGAVLRPGTPVKIALLEPWLATGDVPAD